LILLIEGKLLVLLHFATGRQKVLGILRIFSTYG
jgi:hypothetical protein